MALRSERIAKNTTYLTTALVIQKALSFFFFLAIARFLGKAGTGDYVAAFAMSSIFGVFIDLGLGSVLIRELARDTRQSETYFGNIVSLKIVLAVSAYLALLGFVKILELMGVGHPPLPLVLVAGMVMVVDSFTLAGTSVFRGYHNLWFESVTIALNKIIVLGLGLPVLLFAPSTLNVMLSVFLGSVVSVGLLSFYLYQDQHLSWQPRWDPAVIRNLMRLAAPFAWAGIFSALYAYSDSVLLSILQGSEAVGLYSVAAKTMNAFQFIPLAFMAAIYPAMSAYYVAAPERLQSLLEASLRYLFIVSAPLAMGLYLLAQEFVMRLGVAYAPAAAAVRILMPSLVFVFLSFPLGALLNATNRQHWQTAVIGLGMVSNVGLNLWLIPHWSYLGASWAWFATNAAIVVVGFWLARQVVAYRLRPLIGSFLRVSLSTVLMALVVLAVEPYGIIVAVLLGSSVYLLALALLRELTSADIVYFYGLFRVARDLDPSTSSPASGSA